ncbi:MAG: 5-(carboxyamino)imidazole ribonucleotide mutase [Thermoplasmata archaeon]|nr:5-(carboxyamino)imidazole ribonucleotide mutase [Candidatus Thermoplasmatota archaeon]MCK4948701.1 5-(carboxyamino)imidazole ribonucleotide mutase [Thermoplasmata archaeon]
MSVLVILGSKSDKKIGDKAVDILAQFGVDSKMIVASAHRSPEYLHDEIEKSDAKVIIAVAGLSAALPGAVASKTTRPVIGVPVSGKISLDSLLSVVQMPPGIPVAAVGLDRGENAAILAVEILSLSDEQLREKLEKHRKRLKEWTIEDSKSIGD